MPGQARPPGEILADPTARDGANTRCDSCLCVKNISTTQKQNTSHSRRPQRYSASHRRDFAAYLAAPDRAKLSRTRQDTFFKAVRSACAFALALIEGVGVGDEYFQSETMCVDASRCFGGTDKLAECIKVHSVEQTLQHLEFFGF